MESYEALKGFYYEMLMGFNGDPMGCRRHWEKSWQTSADIQSLPMIILPAKHVNDLKPQIILNHLNRL